MQPFRGMMKIIRKFIILTFILILLFPSTNFFNFILDHGIQSFNSFYDYRGLLEDFLYQESEIIKNWAEINELFSISIYEDQAVYGKNDFLFLGNEYEKTIDNYRGIDSFSTEENNKFYNSLKSYFDFFDSQDIPFLYVISPNKSTIYPEYMPNWATRNNDFLSSREKFVEKINTNESNYIIDLTNILYQAKNMYKGENKDLLYYHSDSHWSPIGALIAFNKIIYELGYINEENIIPDINNYKVEFTEQRRDLSSLIKLNDFPDFSLTFNMNDNFEERILLSKKIGGPDTSLYYRHNDDALYDKKILIIRDSFSEVQLDFYNHYFSDIYFVYFYSFLYEQNINLDFYSNFYSIDPDIVILQTVERYLKSAQYFEPMIEHHTFFNNGETISKYDHRDFDYRFSKFSYNYNEKMITLEMKDKNASLNVLTDDVGGLKEVFVKLRLNVENNSECFLKYKTASGVFSQNFDLIPGDNLLYYTLEADEPIIEVSLVFEEYMKEPIILYEFELRK